MGNKPTYEELEQTVEERTRELSKINEELKNKKENLEEINTALKVLLQRRDEDKANIEKKLLAMWNIWLCPIWRN